jgi:hypothetical protein
VVEGLMLDFTTNFLEVRPLLKRAGCLKEAVQVPSNDWSLCGPNLHQHDSARTDEASILVELFERRRLIAKQQAAKELM